MGIFASYDDIEKLLPAELRSLLSNDSTDTDSRSVIEYAITLQDEFIIENLQKIYTRASLINIKPQILKTIAVHLIVYRLYRRKTDRVPESVVDDKDAAILWLEQIKKGEIVLDGVATSTHNPSIYYKYDDTYFRGDEWVF
jgi:phage gp36-like protein